jgi:hypothetical protein
MQFGMSVIRKRFVRNAAAFRCLPQELEVFVAKWLSKIELLTTKSRDLKVGHVFGKGIAI